MGQTVISPQAKHAPMWRMRPAHLPQHTCRFVLYGKGNRPTPTCLVQQNSKAEHVSKSSHSAAGQQLRRHVGHRAQAGGGMVGAGKAGEAKVGHLPGRQVVQAAAQGVG